MFSIREGWLVEESVLDVGGWIAPWMGGWGPAAGLPHTPSDWLPQEALQARSENGCGKHLEVWVPPPANQQSLTSGLTL